MVILGFILEYILHSLKEKFLTSCYKNDITYSTHQNILSWNYFHMCWNNFSCSRLIWLYFNISGIDIFQIHYLNWGMLDLLLRNKVGNDSKSLRCLSVAAWCVQWVTQLRAEKRCILENSSNFRYWTWQW